MKRILGFAVVLTGMIWTLACEAPPAGNSANSANHNTNANSNANAAKPVAAAPTKESLMEMDKKANEAWMKGDASFFQGFLGDKFVMYEGGNRMDKAAMLKMIGETKCDVKSYSLDDSQMHRIDDDTYAVIYKGTFDGQCGGQKIPSPVRAVSLYTRSGDKWAGVYHGETMIVDPKNPPKVQPPPPPAKKDEAAKPAPDPNTDAIMAVEKAGWEAWKARDAKKLEEVTTKDLAFVGLFGDYTATQADTIKMWTSGDCKINSTSVTDGQVTMISPTVALMNFKGSADGTCDGQKITPLYGTNVYVKDGGTWKLAFGFETPAA